MVILHKKVFASSVPGVTLLNALYSSREERARNRACRVRLVCSELVRIEECHEFNKKLKIVINKVDIESSTRRNPLNKSFFDAIKGLLSIYDGHIFSLGSVSKRTC